MRPALLDRLVQDAESLAGGGERRGGYALLRWAATACAPDALPTVLVAYHRIRASAAPPTAGERVEIDALGFPSPRFARRAPEPDVQAFVPSSRFPERPRPAAAAAATAAQNAAAPPSSKPRTWSRDATTRAEAGRASSQA